MMKWILALLLFVSGTAIGQTDDNDKYIWYKYQYGSRMPRFFADSVLKAAGLVKLTGLTNKVDTTTYKPIVIDASGNVHKMVGWPGSGGSSGPPALTQNYAGYGGAGNVLSPGEAAYTYDSITNKLTVDSADLIQTRQDSTFFRNHAQYLKPDSAFLVGNSHTVGQGASVTDSAYAYRESAGLDVIPVSVAVSGTGATSIANRFLINKNPGNSTAAIVMNGFNDPRRNGLPAKTLNKIINSHKAIFANQYLKSYTNAGTGGAGVTRSGSWTDIWDASAEGGKATVGAYTSATNDSIRYAFTDSTVIVALMGGDGSSASYIGTDIDVRIDGDPILTTINTNDQTDGVSDGSGLDNKRCAMAFIFTGLTNAAHTITLIKKSTGGGGFMICDYFGHLVDRSQAQLMLWHHIPYMTAAGYATSPANATDGTTDDVNDAIDALKATYPISIYPTYVVPTNTVYDPDIDADPDGIHMADAGHRKIADLALNVTLNDVVPAPGADGAIWYDNDYHGKINGLEETFMMRRAADSRYIRNQNYFTQTANYKISGTGTADKFASVGAIIGNGLSITDRQINGIIGGASSNPFFEIRNNAGAANSKSYGFYLGSNSLTWRILSDDLLTEVRFLEVIRTGLTIDTIKILKLDVTGKLWVHTGDVVADSDSAWTRDASTGELKYAKINSGADGNGIYGGNGTLPSDITVSTGGNTLTVTGSNDSETSFSVTNTGSTAASAIAGNVTGSTGAGVTGTSTTGNGVVGSSSSNYGVVGTSSTTAAFRGQINVASTDAIENTVSLLRTTSAGAGANGLGAAIQYELETATSGTSQTAGRLAFLWSDATNATRTSRFEIYGVDNTTIARKAALAGNGLWTWDGYGAGTHTVTPATTPVISSSGVVGERIAPKIYTALLTATAGNAPTATVLGTNEIGSIVWTRVADGNYTGTLSSAFTANKTWALVQRGDMSGNFINNWISSGSTSTVTLTVSDNLGNPVGDFTNMSIEIRVYP